MCLSGSFSAYITVSGCLLLIKLCHSGGGEFVEILSILFLGVKSNLFIAHLDKKKTKKKPHDLTEVFYKDKRK